MRSDLENIGLQMQMTKCLHFHLEADFRFRIVSIGQTYISH